MAPCWPLWSGAARACEYFAPNLRIVHPWTRASLPGETSALLFMKFDEVTERDRLIGVETPVAERVELAGTTGPVDLDIAAGHETVLSEEGPHLRLLELRHPLEIARSYPLRLRFEKGGLVLATLNVDYLRFR